MVIGSWHGLRADDHSRYERREKERERENVPEHDFGCLKKMLGNSTVCWDSHLYGVISCLCATALPVSKYSQLIAIDRQ